MAPQNLLTRLLTRVLRCVARCCCCSLPLQIRDLYMTFRNFRNRITDFLRFRQVTARMDRFPDATPEDLARCDGICIICREEMVAAGLNKKLHCGHVFHLHCLRCGRWRPRQPVCMCKVALALRLCGACVALATLPCLLLCTHDH